VVPPSARLQYAVRAVPPGAQLVTTAMDNPYESPHSDCYTYPAVEVVLRPRFGWRRYEQIYRFECQIDDQGVLRDRIIPFFARQKTRLLSCTGATLEFERLGTSVFLQLIRFTEKVVPQTISVSLEKSPSGHLVTCDYRLRLLFPDFVVPPHRLEEEVRELASACGV
jgi:hypothetical protein